jgi:hypothetical protein
MAWGRIGMRAAPTPDPVRGLLHGNAAHLYGL